LGIFGSAIAGAAIASSVPPVYAVPPGYYNYYPPGYYPAPVVYPAQPYYTPAPYGYPYYYR
jgi:hypothetical protein